MHLCDSRYSYSCHSCCSLVIARSLIGTPATATATHVRWASLAHSAQSSACPTSSPHWHPSLPALPSVPCTVVVMSDAEEKRRRKEAKREKKAKKEKKRDKAASSGTSRRSVQGLEEVDEYDDASAPSHPSRRFGSHSERGHPSQFDDMDDEEEHGGSLANGRAERGLAGSRRSHPHHEQQHEDLSDLDGRGGNFDGDLDDVDSDLAHSSGPHRSHLHLHGSGGMEIDDGAHMDGADDAMEFEDDLDANGAELDLDYHPPPPKTGQQVALAGVSLLMLGIVEMVLFTYLSDASDVWSMVVSACMLLLSGALGVRAASDGSIRSATQYRICLQIYMLLVLVLAAINIWVLNIEECIAPCVSIVPADCVIPPDAERNCSSILVVSGQREATRRELPSCHARARMRDEVASRLTELACAISFDCSRLLSAPAEHAERGHFRSFLSSVPLLSAVLPRQRHSHRQSQHASGGEELGGGAAFHVSREQRQRAKVLVAQSTRSPCSRSALLFRLLGVTQPPPLRSHPIVSDTGIPLCTNSHLLWMCSRLLPLHTKPFAFATAPPVSFLFFSCLTAAGRSLLRIFVARRVTAPLRIHSPF